MIDNCIISEKVKLVEQLLHIILDRLPYRILICVFIILNKYFMVLKLYQIKGSFWQRIGSFLYWFPGKTYYFGKNGQSVVRIYFFRTVLNFLKIFKYFSKGQKPVSTLAHTAPITIDAPHRAPVFALPAPVRSFHAFSAPHRHRLNHCVTHLKLKSVIVIYKNSSNFKRFKN